MVHTVLDQVRDRPLYKLFIRTDRTDRKILISLPLNGIPSVHIHVYKIYRCLPYKSDCIDLFPDNRLHIIFHLRRQIQVIDEVLDSAALADNGRRFLSILFPQIFGILELRRIPHDHRQRGTDIVGHAGDPVGASGVFLPELIFLRLQHF